MTIVDYHMHTKHSFDGNNTMEEMVLQAIKNGVSEIAFTDHADYLSLSPQYPPLADFRACKRELDYLRNKYEDKISIVFGVEIGIGPHLAEQIADLTSRHNFEFIIGSIHDINFVDIYYPEFYIDKDKKTAYTAFFEYTLDSIKKIQSFDVLGHMDYIERYGRYEDKTVNYFEYREIIDEILKTLIMLGKGIEINTSGYRYNLGHIHPRLEILKRYHELGGEIVTIGSDAHNTNYICSHYSDAVALLKEAGYSAISVYRNRRPVMVDIGF